MADIITAHQGTIDEFIGDAILALFGAPVARADDAERAVACAVAMQLAMEDVNGFNRREGLPEVEMGIAVNTGDVVVGNIGSQTRAKYGVVGTHVNLAGRIEGFTVGGQILVSESTLRKSGGSLTVGERVTFEAKGFQDPVVVYDLRGVGGKHGLLLPERKDSMRPLAREMPVSVTLIEGKQVQDAAVAGVLVKAVARFRRAARADAPVRLCQPAAAASGARRARRDLCQGDVRRRPFDLRPALHLRRSGGGAVDRPGPGRLATSPPAPSP